MTNGIYTFENFVTDKENLFAYSVCRAIAQGGDDSFNPVIISGPGGCGKTHLLYSVYGELAGTSADVSVMYIEMEKFIEKYLISHAGGCPREIAEDVLLIDDAQFLEGKEAAQREVYRMIRNLCAGGKRVVVAMDVPIDDLPCLLAEAKTDIGESSLCILDIQSPSKHFKMKFINEMCNMSEIELDEASVNYLADSLGDNFRVIKGCIKMIRFYKDISSADIDLCWLKKNITNEIRGA